MDDSAAETAASRRRLVEDQLAAFNAHDPDGYASSYADDAVVHDPEYPEPLRGREAIRADMAKFFTAFPDVVGEPRRVLTDGQAAAVEMTMTGVNSGPMGTADGATMPATGQRVQVPVAFFNLVDDTGRIVEERRYYDVSGIFPQAGTGQ